MLISSFRPTETERLEREHAQKAKEDEAKLAADRHKEQVEALAELKRILVCPHHCFSFIEMY